MTAYFPGPAAWYDFYNGSLVSAKGSESITFSCPFDHIQVHLRTLHSFSIAEFVRRLDPITAVLVKVMCFVFFFGGGGFICI